MSWGESPLSPQLYMLLTLIVVLSMQHSNASDRYNIHAQLEHLQSKYTGTGHSDTTRSEWLTNIARDTLANHVQHADRLLYLACAENISVGRMRFRILNSMARPTPQ